MFQDGSWSSFVKLIMMNKFEIIEINTWNRKEHFEFFSHFDEPFFGVVSEFLKSFQELMND